MFGPHTTSRRPWLIAAGAALLLAGCRRAEVASAPDAGDDRSPLSRAELATTDPGIAWGNLDSQINGLTKLVALSRDLETTAKLVSLLLVRARYASTVSDYDRALELAQQAAREHAGDGRAHLMRARVLAALHRFDEAMRELEKSAGPRVSPAAVTELRASILAARGRPGEALALLEPPPGTPDDLESLGLRAALTGQLGERAKAERMFTRAQHLMRDTSPYPLAWLYFQQGLMWQRAGDAGRARVLFTAAHERLPRYAPAVSHLAGVLATMHEPDAAIRLLRPLAAVAEDPEYAGQLAELLASIATSSTTAAAEAERWRSTAQAGYDALMKRHPEAYADHAARFWLAAGDDPARALAAAEKNLAVRETDDAFELALKAALAARDLPAGCRLAARVEGAPAVGRQVRALAALAAESCPAH